MRKHLSGSEYNSKLYVFNTSINYGGANTLYVKACLLLLQASVIIKMGEIIEPSSEDVLSKAKHQDS